MQTRQIKVENAPKASEEYSQCLELARAEKLLFINGQIPMDKAGKVPVSFHEQCVLVWENIKHQLEAAGMLLENIVKMSD